MIEKSKLIGDLNLKTPELNLRGFIHLNYSGCLLVDGKLFMIHSMKILISNIEYITLRILRKFIVKERFINKYKKFIPYYLPSQNELSPSPIVDKYWGYCNLKNVSLLSKNILEIGNGSTNSTGYEIVGRWNAYYYGYEPFAELNIALDRKLYEDIKMKYKTLKKNNIMRIKNLEDIQSNSIDLILSNSVLEHVNNIDSLFVSLKRILKDDGCMIHIVDYRDHFFKYPFHFFQFSERAWNSFLNPGDLPRWRIFHHINFFKKYGFIVDIICQEYDEQSFSFIEKKLHTDFTNYTKKELSVTAAVLFVYKERRKLS